jgi:signal transduction histidine kinase
MRWTSTLVKPITPSSIARVLLAGFTLVILLLLAAGSLGVRNISMIRSTAGKLLEEQQRTSGLLDEVLKEQRAINAIYATFAKQPDELDREMLLGQLQRSDEQLEKITEDADGEPEQALWERTYTAASRFSQEARHLLEDESRRPGPSRELLNQHMTVITLVDRLVEVQSARSVLLKQQLEDISTRLFRESFILLGGGLLLSLLSAVYTVRITHRLVRQMEWQNSELSRVSWHLLENQETAARRFSHELHDELGQSLTAVKANLVFLSEHANGGRDRLHDCLSLVDQAIVNVRELSQLLRPTILDDFGLSAGIKWLCERFTQRTGIEVDYQSNFEDRLLDETETHLFRIAQEALTNVARHSKASAVRVALKKDGHHVRLTVTDNGQGILAAANGKPAVADASSGGMGMVGMRARARSAGGELKVDTAPGRGVAVYASFPYRERTE